MDNKFGRSYTKLKRGENKYLQKKTKSLIEFVKLKQNT